MAMDYQSIKKDIKAGKLSHVYLLQGEEGFFIDQLAHDLEALVPLESRDFNLSILYGKDVQAQDIMDHCRQYPMMAERRVVSVREAQNVKDIDKLDNYLDHIVPTTVLVLSHKYKKVDGRTAFAKKVKKSAVVFESKRLYENQVGKWIATLLSDHGIKYDQSVPHVMAEHLGTDLSRIHNEIEKITANIKEGETLDPIKIEKWVGINRDFNVFELQKAMSKGDIGRVMKIGTYFAANTKDHHPLMIFASLYSYFSKLLIMGMNKSASPKALAGKLKINPYFISEYQQALRFWNGKKVLGALQLLSEYDLKLKGVNNRTTKPGDLLQEFLLRVMYI
jgi:DNA polymerase-3 subunit delta